MKKLRTVGWLGTAAIAAALILPAATFATVATTSGASSHLTNANATLNVSPVVWDGVNGWDQDASQPKSILCDGTNAGTMLWIYTGNSDTPVVLTMNGVDYTGAPQGQGNGSWHIVTPFVTSKPSASLAYTGDYGAGTLTISHGCPGAQPTPTEAQPTPTEAQPTPTEAQPTPTEAQPTPTEAQPTPTEAQPTPTATLAEILPTPTPTVAAETGKPTPTATPVPAGTVAAETGAPKITPPPTDTIGSGTGSNSGLPLILAGIATLILAVLFVTPSRKRSRR